MADEEIDYLKDGFDLCYFTGKEKDIPSGMNSRLHIRRYIAGLILVDNENLETGEKILKWKDGQQIPEDVIGVVLNRKALLREKVMLTDSNEGQLTPDEWTKAHGNDGLEQWALSQMFYLANGPGVKTPGQMVTDTNQPGQAHSDPDRKPVKIGGKDGRKYP